MDNTLKIFVWIVGLTFIVLEAMIMLVIPSKRH